MADDTVNQRDLTPGPSGEFAHSGVNIWGHVSDIPILPDKSEYPLGEGLRHKGLHVRVPDRIGFANLALAATAGLVAQTQLSVCGVPQNGVLVALNGIITNLGGPPGLVTINLQNYEGNIYNQAVLSAPLPGAVFSSVPFLQFWAFSDVHFPFTRGLYLVATNGAAVGNYTGEISLNAVWHA